MSKYHFLFSVPHHFKNLRDAIKLHFPKLSQIEINSLLLFLTKNKNWDEIQFHNPIPPLTEQTGTQYAHNFGSSCGILCFSLHLQSQFCFIVEVAVYTSKSKFGDLPAEIFKVFEGYDV
jgi:hypothetical protein